MKLAEASAISKRIAFALMPHINDIVVAGSIRRKCPEVKDVDIVLIPRNIEEIKKICLGWHPAGELFAQDCEKPKWGERAAAFNYKGEVGVDLYFATEKSFANLLLIRTGSKEHNQFLCDMAKKMGMYLAADGSGLFADRKKEKPLPSATEKEIFEGLGLTFQHPEKRDRENLNRLDRGTDSG